MISAIALFAKAPRAGLVKTRLTPPLTPTEAARVARASLEHTIRSLVPAIAAEWHLFLDGPADDALRELTLDHRITVRPQSEGDLGDRLRSAFRTLWNAGAPRALALGSDSPTLDPNRIAEAEAALDAHDLVLGPAQDGGYYLLGLHAREDRVFDGIPWSTSGVARATLERARDAGLTAHVLPPWYDLDDVASLRRALADLETERGGAGTEASGLRGTLESIRDRLGS